jgi:hypothetical protein
MKLEHIKVEHIWAVVLDAAIQAEGTRPRADPNLAAAYFCSLLFAAVSAAAAAYSTWPT